MILDSGVRCLPILFNTDMVWALLENRKTVTRRVLKPQPVKDELRICHWKDCHWMEGGIGFPASGIEDHAPYHVGDILYVRETWSICDNLWDGTDIVIYRAGYNGGQNASIKWRPPIHMPHEFARIFLRVTGMRVERLGEITEEQAQAEGFFKGWKRTEQSSMALTATQAFMWSWDYLIKPADRALYGWAANPWVWVIEFERCEKPEGWPA